MKEKVCPRCSKKYTGHSALSRRDNETDICSDCGTDEAMFEMSVSRGAVSDKLIKEEKSWLLKRGKDSSSASGGFQL